MEPGLPFNPTIMFRPVNSILPTKQLAGVAGGTVGLKHYTYDLLSGDVCGRPSWHLDDTHNPSAMYTLGDVYA